MVPGSLVLVSNGAYGSGGRVKYGALTNRVVVDAPIIVRSVNGPAVTVIEGAPSFFPINGDAAVRGVYLGTNATLSGFTVSNGYTRAAGPEEVDQCGGGVWCEASAVLSNCVLAGNSAEQAGGGVYGGLLVNCTLTANRTLSDGGGAYKSLLSACTLVGNTASNGGGAVSSTLNDCMVSSNTAVADGGGASEATLNRCVLTGNAAARYGGGAIGSKLNHCLLLGNSASMGGGTCGGYLEGCTIAGNTATNSVGGGVFDGEVNNCIVYHNNALLAPNRYLLLGEMSNSCTTPLPPGSGNITNDPQFVSLAGASYELSASSPCINAGLNFPLLANALDLAGRPRVMGGRVDMGAYEFRYEAVLKGALGGAWLTNSGLMRAGLLASNSPYAAAVATATNVPTNAVDWVLVSVRESPTGAPAAAVSAILLADGRIVGADGGSNVNVEAKGNLYGVLQHRNHLAVMSAGPVFTNRIVTFDFAGNPSGLWGGSNAVVQVSSNRWAMMAGNADGDGQVRGVDDAIRRTQTP